MIVMTIISILVGNGDNHFTTRRFKARPGRISTEARPWRRCGRRLTITPWTSSKLRNRLTILVEAHYLREVSGRSRVPTEKIGVPHIGG